MVSSINEVIKANVKAVPEQTMFHRMIWDTF